MNDTQAHSQTLDHVISYPLISDAISMYQQNSIGAQSISVFHSLYDTIAKPVLPYLQTPYSVIKPYLEKADSLGDSTLSSVDSQFPAVKNTDFSALKTTVGTFAAYPFKIADQGKDYLVSTYDDEAKKTGGTGIVASGKALISTEIRMTVEALHKVADVLGQRETLDGMFSKLKTSNDKKLQQTEKAVEDNYRTAKMTASDTTKEVKEGFNEHVRK